jgi:hypothetical protein
VAAASWPASDDGRAMNFPSFGDAEAYAQLGRTCADAIAGPGAVFEGCYHPIRPAGIALLMAVPYLATDDPVDAAYVALALNVVFFAGVVACLAAALVGDRALLEGRPRREAALAAAAFAVLLPNLVAHLPIRLGDLPPLAAFMAALLVAVRTAAGSWSGRPLLRRYLICGAVCSIAVLLNVRYFAYAFILLGSLLALDGNARGSRLRCAAAFVVGMAPVAVQVLNVFLHTGQLGLYDREFMRDFPHREYGVEAVFATIPDRTAYMVRVAGEISRLDVVVLRLFRGLFGFEWAVYHGEPSQGPVWALGAADRVLAWTLMLAYFAFSGWVVRKGTPSLRLITLTAAASTLVPAVLVHTELRYYVLPRAVLWLTLGLTALAAVRPRARNRVPPGASSA